VSYPSSPIEVCDQIRMSTNAVFAVIDKFRTRPDRGSQTALDEVRVNLTSLRREFSDYEPVLDRIAEQISAHALRHRPGDEMGGGPCSQPFTNARAVRQRDK
jgi:hypothetical protein